MIRLHTPGRPAHGFTLVELMIAVAVMAILTTAAVPNFMEPLRKSRRVSAIVQLHLVQLAQENYRSTHLGYAATLSDLGMAPTTTDGLYTISISDADASGYAATASVVAGSTQAGDVRCSVLRLAQDGQQTTYASRDAKGVDNLAARNACWNR